MTLKRFLCATSQRSKRAHDFDHDWFITAVKASNSEGVKTLYRHYITSLWLLCNVVFVWMFCLAASSRWFLFIMVLSHDDTLVLIALCAVISEPPCLLVCSGYNRGFNTFISWHEQEKILGPQDQDNIYDFEKIMFDCHLSCVTPHESHVRRNVICTQPSNLFLRG